MVFAAGLAVSDACSTTQLYDLQAPIDDFVSPTGLPSPRRIQVGFINNTPFRAIFTAGGYVPLNSATLPVGFVQLRVEGNTSSAAQIQPCSKLFSVGGQELIKLINDNITSPAINVTDQQALVVGVNFSSAPAGDPLAAEPTEGTAQPLEVTNGTDFTCVRTTTEQLTGTGVLLFTFEQDAAAPGGFRIDFSFVAP
ncbi:MAG TPA: hypothetical protein VMV81_07680 [Phycisphaerae bacterium]|nr:hypothetical protein [Phycisphaerae bacterium]